MKYDISKPKPNGKTCPLRQWSFTRYLIQTFILWATTDIFCNLSREIGSFRKTNCARVSRQRTLSRITKKVVADLTDDQGAQKKKQQFDASRFTRLPDSE